MGKIRQINIKNRTYYFYNDQIDLKDFDARLLKIEKKDYNEIEIYYIGYVTIKKIGDYNNIDSVNPLYLMINKMIGRFEEKTENKYLNLHEIDENKEVFNKYKEVLEGIKKEIETINKIDDLSNDDLPLNKLIKFHNITIIIRCVFSENGKFYPQLFLDDALYEL